MSKHRTTSHRLPLLATACILLAVHTGCDCTEVVWLPDSSGFVYTNSAHQLVLYDVAKAKRKLLVADTDTETILPAVSPDGKRIAVAGRFGTGPAEHLEVIVYDLDGKELERFTPVTGSEKILYPKGNIPSERDMATALLWGPKGNEDKLAVVDVRGVIQVSSICDLKTKQLVGFLPFQQTLSRLPDSGGLLTFDGLANVQKDPEAMVKSIALVDWDGKSHPILMKPSDKKRTEKAPGFDGPAEKWDGTTFIGTLPGYQVYIDTEKRVGEFEPIAAAEKPTANNRLLNEYTFPNGGATVRVVSVPKQAPFLRLEVVKPGDKEPQVILAHMDQYVSLIPSPDKKLLAVRIVSIPYHERSLPNAILLLNSEGKVVKQIFGADEFDDFNDRVAAALVQYRKCRVVRDDKDPARPVVEVYFRGEVPLSYSTLMVLLTQKKLRVLDLGKKSLNIQDVVVAKLADLPELQVLNLAHTGATDEGLKALAALTKLRVLDLHDTKVTDAGLAEFKKALPHCEVMDFVEPEKSH